MSVSLTEQGRIWPPTKRTMLGRLGKCDDHEGLDAFFRAYWPPVYAYARSVLRQEAAESEDLAQSLFSDKILKDKILKTYDPGKGSSFRAWLKRVVENLLKDRLRRLRAERTHVSLEEVMSGLAAEADDMEVQAARSYLERGLEQLKKELEEKRGADHPAFVMECVTRGSSLAPAKERMSGDQLARKWGVPVKKVYSATKSGMKRLREIIQELLKKDLGDDWREAYDALFRRRIDRVARKEFPRDSA